MFLRVKKQNKTKLECESNEAKICFPLSISSRNNTHTIHSPEASEFSGGENKAIPIQRAVTYEVLRMKKNEVLTET